VGENRGETNETCLVVDARPLDRGDLMFSQRLADNLKAAGQRRVAECPIAFPGKGGMYGRDQRLFRVDELALGFGQRARNGND
jgi:hypothetical protein